MRAVLDTGILISALISDRSYPYKALELWTNRAYTLVTSEWQIEELRKVSRYKHITPLLKPHEVGRLVNRLRDRAEVIRDLPEVAYSPDPDDNPIIAAALKGGAHYIVSGDKGDLLALRQIEGVSLVTARAFVERLS